MGSMASKSAVQRIVNYDIPNLAGLSIHFAWLAAPLIRLLSEALAASVDARMATCFPLISMLVSFAAVCVAVAFLRDRITSYLRRKWVHLLAGVGGMVGMIILNAAFLVDVAWTIGAYAFIGSAFIGISGGVLTILWGETSRRRKPSFILSVSAFAFTLAAALCVLMELLQRESQVVALLLCCTLPFVSVVFLYKAQHGNANFLLPQELFTREDGSVIASEGRYWIETYDELKVSKVAFALNVALCFVPFGMVAGFLALLACISLEGGFVQAFLSGGVDFLVRPLGALALVILLANRFRGNECDLLGRVSIPFFLPLILLTLPWSGVGSTEAGSASLALLAVFLPMMWLMPAELIKRYRLSAPVSYGFHLAAFSVGFLIPVILFAATGVSLVSGPGVSVAILVLGTMGFCTLITEEKMGRLVEKVQLQEKGELPESETYAFYEKCKTISDIYLLSQREHEILRLLARGRNAAFIQRKLTISEGTVRTHMRNIYRKIDVHSQQELMNLVEQVGGEGAFSSD